MAIGQGFDASVSKNQKNSGALMVMPKAKQPKVSVVVTFYNIEQYVEDCLESILGQSLHDLDIICIDDGSVDGTAGLLDVYEEKDSRVRVVHQRNSGAGMSRNRGLELATGEYIIFLDGDDIYKRGMLESAYAKASLTRSDVCIFRSEQFIDGHHIVKTPWVIKEKQIPAVESFRWIDISPNRFFAVQGWAWDKLIRMEFIRQAGLKFSDLKIYNDMAFSFSSLMLARRITYLDRVLLRQRKRTGSLSHNSSPYWECLFHALRELGGAVEKDGDRDVLSDYFEYVVHMTKRQLLLCTDEDGEAMRRSISERWDACFKGCLAAVLKDDAVVSS